MKEREREREEQGERRRLVCTLRTEHSTLSLSLGVLSPSLSLFLSSLSLVPLFADMAPKPSAMTVKQLHAALKKKKIDFGKAKKAELVAMLEAAQAASEGGGAGPVSRGCVFFLGLKPRV